MYPLTMTLNGESVSVEIEPFDLLVDVLRDKLGLTGTKIGCNEGECGACTVIMDGETVNSCLVLAAEANGKSIVTVEGVGSRDKLHPVQKAFVEHGGMQCGFCTPGMIVTATYLLNENPHPTEEEIREGLAGNFCRCTGYTKIIESIEAAAEMMSKGGES